MPHLVDGEIASNKGGWQWSAGTGADAALQSPPTTLLHPDYPLPIVDHSIEREETLKRFKQTRQRE
ncbi:hypothetical protein BH11VER1_BH11VER1_42290 [soil metagenome]